MRGVAGVTLTHNPSQHGALDALEFADLPFTVRRLFVVSGVPAGTSRGNHAHRTCHQLMLALTGRVDVRVTDGEATETITLDDPNTGLVVAPLVWAGETYLSPDAVLAVLCSEPYNPDEYITNFDQFRKLAGSREAETTG